MSLSFWKSMVIEAVRDPRANALNLMRLPMSGSTLPEALVLIAVLSTLALYLVAGLAGVPLLNDSPMPPPVMMAVLQVLIMTLLAGAMTVIGRLFGGQGSFEGALRVIVWLQTLMILLQVVQFAVLILLPMLGGMLSIIAMVGVFWVAAGLIAGLHGFRSVFFTFLGMIGGLVVVAIIVSILLAPFLPAVV